MHTAVLIVLPGHGCVNNGGMAVWTMGHGCVQEPGCVEGHPWTWGCNAAYRNKTKSATWNAHFLWVTCKCEYTIERAPLPLASQALAWIISIKRGAILNVWFAIDPTVGAITWFVSTSWEIWIKMVHHTQQPCRCGSGEWCQFTEVTEMFSPFRILTLLYL